MPERIKSTPSKGSASAARVGAVAPAPSANRWWLHAIVIFGLLLVNVALYHRTLDLGFLSLDDPDYVTNNPLLDNFGTSNFKRILTQPYFANYAPVNILSYALDLALAGGKNPFAVHLSNLAWNGWVACMVYLLAFTIWPRVAVAAAAAFLFLLHPAHVEVAAWISCRKDLIATGFAALSMTCYLLYHRDSRHRAWWYAGSLFCFLLACAGKQSVLLLPLVMLVWDFFVEERRSWRMLADKVLFGATAIFFGWMTFRAQPSTNHAWHVFVPAATELINLWLLTGLGDYVLYRSAPDPAVFGQTARLAIIFAALLVWAVPLLPLLGNAARRSRSPSAPEQPKPAPTRSGLRAGRISGDGRSTAVMVPPWSGSSKVGMLLTALYCWTLIQMVPPMLLNFMVPITDRYLFLPSVGVCILLAISAAELAARFPPVRWSGWAVIAGLGAVWGVKTSNYIDEWRDPRSVWYGAHLKTKNSQVFQFLGEIYQNAGERVDDFIKSRAPLQISNELNLAQAVLGEPARTEQLRIEWIEAGASPRTNSIAYRDLLWSLATKELNEAVMRRGGLSTPNLFMNRGRLFVRQGKPELAINEFKIALSFAETSSFELVRQETATHALFAIGVAHWNLHNYKEAERWLLQAQERQRKSGRAWIPALDREVERIKTLTKPAE